MEFFEIAKLIGIVVFAYMLGSIPCGLVFTRLFISEDIRKKGSGNIGAANVRRVAGTKTGILVLTGDLLKGIIPLYLAGTVIPPDISWKEIYVASVGFAAFSGHLYPLYLKFRTGGKGVATAAGCFLVIAPKACLIAILIFIVFVIVSNYVSVGSMAAAFSLPFTVWWDTRSGVMTVMAVVIFLFIVFRHKDNMKRLLSGTESVVRPKNKKMTTPR